MSNAVLSKKQTKVFNFLKSFSKEHGYAPSLKEIGEKFDISVSAAQQYLRSLILKGFISRIPNVPRSITFKDESPQKRTISLPILGMVSAGEGIEIFEEPSPELTEVNRNLINPSFIHYCLKVRGDSMIQEGIADGDTIVVRQQNTVDNGEIALAVFKGNFDEKATLKKFYKIGDRIELRPRNPKFPTLTPSPEEVEIRGKFVGLIRNP